MKWVDEVGEPIADLEVVFAISGQRHPARTDRAGVARYTDPEGSTFASAEPKTLGALREAVRPRWDTVREGEILTEADAHLVTLAAAMSGVTMMDDDLQIISVQPYVERVRLLGGYFDTAKSFILPDKMPGVRAIASAHARLRPVSLLLTGHTDTSGEPDYNDPLSLERADAVRACLTRDVPAWLKCYASSVPPAKRWAAKEDLLMLESLPDEGARVPIEPPIRWFQRTRGLTVDNIAGPQTRTQLITEYMALAGPALAADAAINIHGCGESFPLGGVGNALSGHVASGDRRVEAYFFDALLGVQPAPTGRISKPGSPEYPEWVKRTRRTEDHGANSDRQLLSLRLHDDYSIPMPHAHAVATLGEREIALEADGEGFVHLLLPPACSPRINVRWGPPGSSSPLRLELDVIVDCDAGDRPAQDYSRLHNLGYGAMESLTQAAMSFQLEYGVDLDDDYRPLGLQNGELPSASYALLNEIFEGTYNATKERG